MGIVNLRRLEDFLRFEAELRVQCRQCGREARFSVHTMITWFRIMRWSTSLDEAPYHFKCKGPHGEGCGSRNVRLSAVMPEGMLPPERPRPRPAPPCPAGIDEAEWNRADERGRKRLVERMRS